MKTDDELREILRATIGTEYGGLAAFCREYNLNHAWVSTILSGKRPMSPAVAAAIGYQRSRKWEKTKRHENGN